MCARFGGWAFGGAGGGWTFPKISRQHNTILSERFSITINTPTTTSMMPAATRIVERKRILTTHQRTRPGTHNVGQCAAGNGHKLWCARLAGMFGAVAGICDLTSGTSASTWVRMNYYSTTQTHTHTQMYFCVGIIEYRVHNPFLALRRANSGSLNH